MMAWIKRMLTKTSGSLSQAALLLAIGTFGSQILGLVRDRLFAGIVGPGANLDVYYTAFRIPDFLYISIASLASITVLMPALTSRLRDDASGGKAKRFFSEVLVTLGGTLIIVSLVLFILMPILAPLLAPGFDAAQLHQLVAISRIMLVSPILLGISNTVATVTQMEHRFLVYTLAPVVYNIGIIIGIVALFPVLGINGLAVGVVIGAFLHVAIQIPGLRSSPLRPMFLRPRLWKELGSVALVSLPRTFGLSISSLTAIILGAFVTRTGVGSASIFNLAYNLQNVPIGIIGISVSVASFPALVKLFQSDDKSSYVEYVTKAMRHIVMWSIPVTVLFIVLRAQIIRVLLGTHAFSWDHTRLASAALVLFVLSVVAQSLVHLFVRASYAEGDTKHPVVANIIGEVITIALAFALPAIIVCVPGILTGLEAILRVGGVENTGMLVFPLVFTIGNIINIILLFVRFSRRWKPNLAPFWKTALWSTGGSLLGGAVSYGILQLLSGVVNQDTFWGIVIQGGLAGIAGVLVWGGVCFKLLRKNSN